MTEDPMVGQRFNKLTVIRYQGSNAHNRREYECLCDCGNRKIVTGNALRTGNTKSCGCLHYKGDNIGADSGRMRARRLYKDLGICENCGKHPATDRHHINGDTKNNDRSNISFLCRSCHMYVDGRSDALHSLPREVLLPKTCSNCGKTEKDLRRGRCHACNEYFRRNNLERPYHSGYTIEQARIEKKSGLCKRCEKPKNRLAGNPVGDYCRSCYAFLYRKGLI